MDVYLVRHTTPNVKSDICYGQADVGLASTFDDEFNQLNTKISHLVDPLVFTSPLQRCLNLAQKAVEHFNFRSLKTDERLLELNFGDWELKPWADIPQGVLGEWSDEHVKEAPPNGESYFQLHQRAAEFLKDLGECKHSKEALVFTHAGVIRALVSEALNKPLREASRVEVKFGSVTHIIINDGITRLGFVNR